MEIKFLGRKIEPVCNKVIVFSEKDRKYEAKLYLVELKGCDKAHAFEQLLATMDYMSGKDLKRIYFPRIVVSKDSAPKIKSTAEKRMEKLVNSHKCEKCIVSTRFYSESI